MGRLWRVVWTTLDLEARDALLLLGLALVAAGLAEISRAAALIGPGAILIYLALWHRPPAPPAGRGRT